MTFEEWKEAMNREREEQEDNRGNKQREGALSALFLLPENRNVAL